MKCRSHFSHVIPIFMMLSACETRAHRVIVVDDVSYGARECWFDHNGNFSAFLVMAQDGGVVVPYPISSKCIIRVENHTSFGTIFGSLNTIILTDSNEILHRRLPNFTFSSNIITDQPIPSEDSEIYFIRGIVSTKTYPNLNRTTYDISYISELNDMHFSFGEFISFTTRNRRSIMEGVNE